MQDYSYMKPEDQTQIESMRVELNALCAKQVSLPFNAERAALNAPIMSLVSKVATIEGRYL